ncbi:ArsR/SmtB family transcription factor [Rhizomonospora bruguierae]|uniref:ArsR/SmtB family transcription factor n=1 Tax=Rhizomonospora bruguierae TaxID=1581705 RepID=UPI001BCD7BF1|nr:helix-turn-helix domain-containing protein [Micromonospora sp. NBRC 107566]
MSLGDELADATGQLRMLAHPIRIRILSLLTGAAMTAAEVARELDLTHANASYHLRQLLAHGVIEIAGEEQIRGGVAKRYRYRVEQGPVRVRAPHSPTDASEAGRRMMIAAVAAELRRRAERERFAPGSILADAELWVEQAAWERFRERVQDAALDLHRAARPPRTQGTAHVSATIVAFRMETGA